jgi:hypothetical protein
VGALVLEHIQWSSNKNRFAEKFDSNLSNFHSASGLSKQESLNHGQSIKMMGPFESYLNWRFYSFF